MVCPGCKSYVPQDAVICDTCNAVLDTDLLGDVQDDLSPQNAAGDRTPPRGVPAPLAPALAEPPSGPAPISDPLSDFAAQYRSFTRGERLATIGAGLLLVALGLPWLKTRGDGELIGYFAGMWFVGVLAGLVAVGLLFRRHPRVQPFTTAVVLGEVVASAMALLLSVMFSRSALSVERVWASGKAYAEVISQPLFGVYLGIAAAALMLAGAALTWIDRGRLE